MWERGSDLVWESNIPFSTSLDWAFKFQLCFLSEGTLHSVPSVASWQGLVASIWWLKIGFKCKTDRHQSCQASVKTVEPESHSFLGGRSPACSLLRMSKSPFTNRQYKRNRRKWDYWRGWGQSRGTVHSNASKYQTHYMHGGYISHPSVDFGGHERKMKVFSPPLCRNQPIPQGD